MIPFSEVSDRLAYLRAIAIAIGNGPNKVQHKDEKYFSLLSLCEILRVSLALPLHPGGAELCSAFGVNLTDCNSRRGAGGMKIARLVLEVILVAFSSVFRPET